MKIVALVLFLISAFYGLALPQSHTLSRHAEGVSFNSCSPKNKIIHHQEYSLLYNEEAEQAEWVAYRLTSSSIAPGIDRTNDYREDPSVGTGSAQPEDYIGSGYDRGHLAPARSMKSSVQSMSESFLLSNISPQLSEFNRGVWKRLEEKVRYWVGNHDSILVVSGPVLKDPLTTIGENKVVVPRAFFKTLVAFKGEQVMGIAFLVPHAFSHKSLYSFATSIDVVEELTGIDFYCNLNNPTQDTVEKNSKVKDFLFRE